MEEIKKVNLDSIINKDGIVVRWPKKKDEKLAVLNYLLTTMNLIFMKTADLKKVQMPHQCL